MGLARPLSSDRTKKVRIFSQPRGQKSTQGPRKSQTEVEIIIY